MVIALEQLGNAAGRSLLQHPFAASRINLFEIAKEGKDEPRLVSV